MNCVLFLISGVEEYDEHFIVEPFSKLMAFLIEAFSIDMFVTLALCWFAVDPANVSIYFYLFYLAVNWDLLDEIKLIINL